MWTRKNTIMGSRLIRLATIIYIIYSSNLCFNKVTNYVKTTENVTYSKKKKQTVNLILLHSN